MRRQLLLQLLRLLLDGAEVILHGLAGMHPSVKAVVQAPPKPARQGWKAFFVCDSLQYIFIVAKKKEKSKKWSRELGHLDLFFWSRCPDSTFLTQYDLDDWGDSQTKQQEVVYKTKIVSVISSEDVIFKHLLNYFVLTFKFKEATYKSISPVSTQPCLCVIPTLTQ